MTEEPKNDQQSPIEKKRNKRWQWDDGPDESKRSFLKFLGITAVGTTAAYVGDKFGRSRPRGESGNLETPERLSNEHLVYIIDFFERQSNQGTVDRLSQTIETQLNLDGVSFEGIEVGNEAVVALRAYVASGESNILTSWALNTILEVVSDHGHFVYSTYQEHSNSAEDSVNSTDSVEASPVMTLGLQNVIEDLQIENDRLGNITIKGKISEERLAQLLKDNGFDEDSVLITAFQFGEIEANYNLFKIDTRVITVEGTDNSYTIFDPLLNQEGALALVQRIEGNDTLVISVGGETHLVEEKYYRLYDGDRDSRNIQTEIAEFEESVKQEFITSIADRIDQEGGISDELRQFVQPVNSQERVGYTEPYNDPENLGRYKQFCEMFPETCVVHAAGNNTDMRDWQDERPINGILVAGIGGEGRAYAFGTNISRNVGGIGADIYVSKRNLRTHTQDNSSSFMSSSEATAIIGSYAKQLKDLGIETGMIKEILQENCCTYLSDDDQNTELRIAEGEYLSAHVFDIEKAKNYIKSLQVSRQTQVHGR